MLGLYSIHSSDNVLENIEKLEIHSVLNSRIVNMKILVTGNCARSHAIISNIIDDNRVTKIYWAPGNAGITSSIIEKIPINPDDVEELVTFAKKKQIDFTIAGQNIAFYRGIVNKFNAAGLKIFGPTSEAAKLEWNKIFAKQFFEENNIPSPNFFLVTGEEQIISTANTIELPVIIKYDGLAYGRGVFVCFTRKQALNAVNQIIYEKFKTISGRHDIVIFEEYVTGKEVSMFFIVDGNNSVFIGEARDYKKAFDGDTGPNTAGMGSYSPCEYLDKKTYEQIIDTIIHPTIQGMKKIGHPYKGVLYAGIMLTDKGPLLLEYNCRFGDPECQVLLPRLKSNLLDILLSENLRNTEVKFNDKHCVSVCMCSYNYPEQTDEREDIIYGLDKVENDDITVYHYGTKNNGLFLMTPTGRVLSVSATGRSRQEAHNKIYKNISSITWKGCQYRKDIGLLV